MFVTKSLWATPFNLKDQVSNIFYLAPAFLSSLLMIAYQIRSVEQSIALIAIGILFLNMLLFSVEHNILLVFYTTPLVLLYSFANNTTSFVSYYSGAVALLIIIRKKNIKFNMLTFLVYLLLIVYDLLHIRDESAALATLRLAVNLLFALTLLSNIGRTLQVNYWQIGNLFVVGSLVHVIGGVIQSIFVGLVVAGRFRGANSDINYTAAIMLIALAFVLHRAIVSRNFGAINLGLIGLFLLAGMGTASRMFLLGLVPISIVILIYLIKNGIQSVRIILVTTLISALLFQPMILPLITQISQRFEVADISNHRIATWNAYIDIFFSTPTNTLWGLGRVYAFDEQIGITQHSIYLESLVSWGIVGSGIYILFYLALYRSIKMPSSPDQSSARFLVVLVLLLAYSTLSGLTAQVVVVGLSLGLLAIKSEKLEGHQIPISTYSKA